MKNLKFLLLVLPILITSSTKAQCNWAERITDINGQPANSPVLWDSCEYTNDSNSIIHVMIQLEGVINPVIEYTVNGMSQNEENRTFYNQTFRSYMNHIPRTNGTFEYCITINDTNNSCDTTICRTYTRNCFGTASISNFDTDDLSISPNPTFGQINIQLESTIKSLKVYSISGELIDKVENVNRSNYQYRFNSAKGMYFIEVLTEDNVLLRKKVLLH